MKGALRQVLVFVTVLTCSACILGQQGATAGKADLKALPANSSDADVGRAVAKNVDNAQFIVGEDDVLRISVWKEPEISGQVVVRPDGVISLPLVGDVKVAGLSPLKIQAVLTDKLASFIERPNVTVSVIEIRSRTVYITGEISRPGSYPLLTRMTVLQLIAKAGGLGQFADGKSIFVLRGGDAGKQKLSFNYHEVLKGKGNAKDIELAPGDTVVVP